MCSKMAAPRVPPNATGARSSRGTCGTRPPVAHQRSSRPRGHGKRTRAVGDVQGVAPHIEEPAGASCRTFSRPIAASDVAGARASQLGIAGADARAQMAGARRQGNQPSSAASHRHPRGGSTMTPWRSTATRRAASSFASSADRRQPRPLPGQLGDVSAGPAINAVSMLHRPVADQGGDARDVRAFFHGWYYRTMRSVNGHSYVNAAPG